MEESALLGLTATPTQGLPLRDKAFGSALAEHSPLHSFFQVMPGDMQQEAELAKLWQYGVERAGTTDRDAVFRELTTLKYLVGSPNMGESPWGKMLAYQSAINDLKTAERTLRSLTA